MKAVVALVQKLRDGADSTEQVLRQFAKAHTFPMLEQQAATFFFWDGKPTDEVRLLHWVFGLESSQTLRRIEGTDAFFLPVELPEAARVEYKFEIWRKGKRIWVRDPRNPLLARDPFGANSVCQMPGYHEPPWTAPSVERQGELVSVMVPSASWGADRHVTVYLPYEYQQRKRYPLLVCHDGSDYLRFASAASVLDRLIQRHEVAPIIMAFVDPGPDRNREYAANTLQARFLVEDLLPALEKDFGVSRDPDERGLMGASFGAVSSLFAAWTRPGAYGRLLLQSGSFAFTDIGHHERGPLWDPIVEFVNQFRQDPGRIDARVFMSCGCFESLIYYNRSLVPRLRQAGLDVRFVESLDGHNWISWRDRLRDGLTWLYPGHLWMYYE